MMQTVATGWWCRRCEFVELEDEVDTTNDQCRACGCEGGYHVSVDVVTKGLV